MIAEAAWQEAVDALRRPGRILLAGHVQPDSDALGSVLALGLALRSLGADVVGSFSDPFVVPESLRFLPGQDLLVSPAEAPKDPDLFVSLDASSVQRLGTLADRLGTAGRVLVVDHHASNPGFGGINLVDADAPATAVLADELIRRLGVDLDADLATCIYAGVVGDTGSFKYAGTTPATHELASRLLATGIAHDEITRELFDTHPYRWLSLLGDVLGRATLEPEAAGGHGLVWTYATADDLRRHDLSRDDYESLIGIIRTTREAEVAMVLKELSGGQWSVSMRSKGKVDVAAIAVALGGGGHRQAAGFNSKLGPAETVDAVRRALAPAAEPTQAAG